MLDLAGEASANRSSQPVETRAAGGAKSLLSAQTGSPRLSTRQRVVHDQPQVSQNDHLTPRHDGDPAPVPNQPSTRFASLKRGLGAGVSNLLDIGRPENADARQAQTDGIATTDFDGTQSYDNRAAPHYQPRYDTRGEAEKPLLDLSIMIAAVWRCRALIIGTTILGAIAGVFIALSTPREYYAETRLFIDPREIRFTEDELRSPLMSTEAMIAMTDSQIAILTSTNVLIQVVDDLGLARDPEFNNSLNSGGISGGIALIKQLFSGKDASSEAETEALSNLRDALTVSRDPKTFVMNIGITSWEPEKSALVANAIVETYLKTEGEAQSGLMERTSDAIDSRLEALRSDLNVAERAVENFKAENDLISVGPELIDDQQITAINQQLANARATKVAVGVKADGLAKANVADVIDGAFPEEFLSANLVELRKQYSQSKANADSLGSQLGPRHPQFVAANSSLESIKSQIRSELRRIVASSQSEMQRAVETEQELASQLAVAKTRSLENSEELVTLRELDRKATATRQIYEGFLKRSREASERGNFNTQNARVISPAEPPLHPDGTSRKIIVIGGMVAGMVFGLAIALLLGMLESIRGFLPGSGGGGRRVPVDGPRPGSTPSHQSAQSFPPAQPAATSAAYPTGGLTGNTEFAKTASRETSNRDENMSLYDPTYQNSPYGPMAPQPMQPTQSGHPAMHYPPAYQGYPYFSKDPSGYHGQMPIQGQGGYAPVPPQPQPQSYWQQVPPAGFAPSQPIHPAMYPSAPQAWGHGQAQPLYAQPQHFQPEYPQPQHYRQPAPYQPAGWVQPPQHQPMQQQPVQQAGPMYYQQPAQAPGVQHSAAHAQATDNRSHASSDHHSGQNNPDAEASRIRQEMDRLRQRIGGKNQRRYG